MRKRTRRRFDFEDFHDDPLSGMANMFDLAMVFAVALMVAVVARLQIPELLTREDVTLMKNPGARNMEIIMKKGREITRYKAGEGSGEGKGRRIGIAYELENGQIIYVPEDKAE